MPNSDKQNAGAKNRKSSSASSSSTTSNSSNNTSTSSKKSKSKPIKKSNISDKEDIVLENSNNSASSSSSIGLRNQLFIFSNSNDDLSSISNLPQTNSEQKKCALKKIISGYTRGISFMYLQRYDISIGCFTTSLGLKQNLYCTIAKDNEASMDDEELHSHQQDTSFLLESSLFDDDQHRHELHSSLGVSEFVDPSSPSPCTFTIYLLRAIAFIGHNVFSKAVVDCDFVLRQMSSYHSVSFYQDGLHFNVLKAYIIKGHALICMGKYKEAYMTFTALLEQVSSQMSTQENTKIVEPKLSEMELTNSSQNCSDDFNIIFDNRDDLFDSLRTLHGLSYHINEMSKKQNKNDNDFDALEQSVMNMCKYCDYYENSIVEHERKRWCSDVFLMDTDSSETVTPSEPIPIDPEDLENDFVLNILDVYCLASSPTDINCRTMGAVLLVDYIASAYNDYTTTEEKFDKIDIQDKRENKSALEEIFAEEEERSLVLNGIDSILDSLCLWDDQELKLFSTRAVTDLCSVDTDCSLRRRIVQYEDGDALRQIIQQLSLIDYIIPDIGEKDDQLCELLEASVSALACIARGGSSEISRTIFEMNGLTALSPIILQVSRSLATQKRPVIKAIHIAECYAYLTVENFDIKEAIVSDEKILLALYKLSLQMIDLDAKNFAIVTIGNCCQNPECWGKPLLLKQISEQVNNSLISKGYIEMLLDIINRKPNNYNSTVIETGNKKNRSIDSYLIELQYNCINTMTGLFGFESGRKRFEKNNGEDILMKIILGSKIEALRDVCTKARTFYITLNDYGDNISEFVFTKCKLLNRPELDLLRPTLTGVPRNITQTNTSTTSSQPKAITNATNGSTSRDEIIKEEMKRFIEMKKKGEITKDFNEAFYSKLMDGILGIGVVNVPEGTVKPKTDVKTEKIEVLSDAELVGKKKKKKPNKKKKTKKVDKPDKAESVDSHPKEIKLPTPKKGARENKEPKVVELSSDDESEEEVTEISINSSSCKLSKEEIFTLEFEKGMRELTKLLW